MPPSQRSATGDGAGPVATGPSAGGVTPGGVTQSGVECRPGVRQFDSAYAAPCRPVWTGSNGGATHRGVSADSVKIVLRRYGDSPDNLFVKQLMAQGGIAPEDVTAPVRRIFAKFFNETYELYGRRVVFEDFTSNGQILKEGAGEGREVACADAAAIAEERNAFGALPAFGAFGPGASGFAGFSDCAVERRLFLPVGAWLYPQRWYRQAHPYAWGVQLDCERLARQYAEYVAKRVANRPARFARDPLYRSTTRVIGLFGTDAPGFRECQDLLQAELEGRYGVKVASRYRYGANVQNDPSVIPRQTAEAVVQFKAAGVTTLLPFIDPFTTANLTSQARSQQWGPEWVMHGAAAMDFDGFARLYDQDRVNGHLFGMSYIGSGGYLGPESEPARLYKKLTGKPLPEGTDGDYYVLVHMFNLLQSAGPALTPEAIGAGAGSLLPGGAPRFDLGRWSFRTSADGAFGLDHTEMDDAREVYWDGDATGADGKKGSFVTTYGGRRFTNGEWPAEDPPVYPKGCTGTCQRTNAAIGFISGFLALSQTRRSAVRR